ncbi:MAG: hypothetical protein LIP23_08850 [Planctomycetes bacterium]|nr:hypothetical protein [Planctomycetota bacterium]
MLSQKDFITMLMDMQAHVSRAMEITNVLVQELSEKELRYKLAALNQTKRMHLDAMNALTTLLKEQQVSGPKDIPAK